MKKLGFVLMLSFFVAGMASAEIELFDFSNGTGEPVGGVREVCFSQPEDPAGRIGSSEVITGILDSFIADDFFLAEDNTITLARWWGGYWNGDPGNFNMNAFFYDDGGCVPGATIAEYLNMDAGQTAVDTYYEYSIAVSVPAVGNTLYWFCAQAFDHDFPPQWGRLAAAGDMAACEAVFMSAYFTYPDWVPASVVFGAMYYASQEFECGVTATEQTTWGSIKGLYR